MLEFDFEGQKEEQKEEPQEEASANHRSQYIGDTLDFGFVSEVYAGNPVPIFANHEYYEPSVVAEVGTFSGELAALGGTDQSTTIRHGTKSIKDLIKETLPSKKIEVIKRAHQWSRSDDLLGGLLNVKCAFSITGLNLFCKPDEGSNLDELFDMISTGNNQTPSDKGEGGGGEDGDEKPMGKAGEAPKSPLAGQEAVIPEELKKSALEHVEFQRQLNLIFRKWEFYDLIMRMLMDWYVTDSIILYWHVDLKGSDKAGKVSSNSDIPTDPRAKETLIPGLISITVLDAVDVDWDNSFGNNKLKVAVPDTVKEKIQKAFGASAKTVDQNILVAFVQEEGIPEKFVYAVIEGDGMVELLPEEGDFWLIKSRNRKYHSLAIPSMYNIFLWLEIRRMFTEGEFAAADMMKHFIQHVKTGESIDSGPLAGQRSNWATKKDTTALYGAISGVNRASRIVTNHTVDFGFIYPPKELFDVAKYARADSNIYSWSGVNVIMYTGEGGTYGSGFIGVKRTMSHVIDARQVIGWIMTEFFDHPEIRGRVGVPDECEVVAQFDATVLKEPRQLLEELKFMVTEGMMDPRTSLSELSRDADSIRRKKIEAKAENDATGLWNPINRKVSTGNSDQIGRPPNDDSIVDDESRNQDPTSGK